MREREKDQRTRSSVIAAIENRKAQIVEVMIGWSNKRPQPNFEAYINREWFDQTTTEIKVLRSVLHK